MRTDFWVAQAAKVLSSAKKRRKALRFLCFSLNLC